jgi:hypothetical protein
MTPIRKKEEGRRKREARKREDKYLFIFPSSASGDIYLG